MTYNKSLFLTEDRDAIVSFLESRSYKMCEHIKNNPNSQYILLRKYLTHSDLINKGKRNGPKEKLDKNYLYYLTLEEMIEIEKRNPDHPFENAKQSNIGLGDLFYEKANIPRLQRRIGAQRVQHEHIKLNDYCNVYLVNDTMKYFTMDYTKKIFDKLNKKPINWDYKNLTITLNNHDWVTDIQITEAIHGIGVKQDIEFQKLRQSMFKNDLFMSLIEIKPDKSKNIFIMLEKNPIFFSIIEESNNDWLEYSTKKLQKEEVELRLSKEVYVEEKTRAQQAGWKNKLAEEIMNFTTKEGEVFCSFTYISSNFEKVSSLFIASHIKRYEHSDAKEAWDINNGLLLCANADALFDKHLITVDENKKIIFSFTIDNDVILKEKLLLNQPIFSMILNEKRMNYLKFHREIFIQKELERKNYYNK